MTTVILEDCPDLDVRTTIQLLEGDKPLNQDQEEAISDLALSWDLPGVSNVNRRWLYNKLLLYAVIGRTTRQVKQLRRGLKETMLWPLLTSRPDVVPLIFPRTKEMQYTPQVVLDRINWPLENDSDEDEDFSLEEKCRTTGFLRTFIENASSTQLAELLKFWVGWEVLPREIHVEISRGRFPSSSTCFERLKLPVHFESYADFETALKASIQSAHTGFGLI
ncbi:uncharacterized protein LOC124483542 [Hypomesus transpacificus]|uniref:uncharacterized protein LOC124483542 n=1 Tax=Hypomesus transpacificus TaxID=137520 RepID=UPI001F085594|nr:uncharacterized protein LOC124483542 [Hypomesus transpacificus]